MKIQISSILALFFVFQMNAQLTQTGESLLFGPLVGAVSSGEAPVFFLLDKGNGNSQFTVRLESPTSSSIYQPNSIKSFCQGDTCSYVATFTGLTNSSALEAVVYMDGAMVGKSWRPFEVPDATPSDFSFLLGSCASMANNVNSPNWAREDIYTQMALEDAKFMLWAGDNVYLPSNDLDTSLVFDTYVKYRTKSPGRNQFLNSFFHFGMWDDHDYSYDNGSADYPDKTFSSKIFKHWWPNAGYAHSNEAEGIQNTYQYKDIEFFNTDPRYYKSRNSQLGSSQLDWLKDKLQQSTATFKFITLGAPVMEEEKSSATTETTLFRTGERALLFDFIYDNNIEGVVFLSGDYHRSHFAKFDPGCNSTYPLYEFMCSPLSSSPSSGSSNYAGVFFEDNTNSYGKIRVSGAVGARSCTIESKDVDGNVISSFTIDENELKFSGQPDIIPDDHLRAHYQCNTEPYDISGNAFHATFTGNSFIGEENRFDESGFANRIKTSNTTQTNTFVLPPESLDTAIDFTISLWARPIYANCGLFSASSATTGNEILVYYKSTGKFSFSFRNIEIESDLTFPTSEWYHVVASHRGSDGLGRLYINSVLVATGIQVAGPTSIVSMLFGNDQDGAGGGNLDVNQQFYGAFDEIRLYDGLLCEYQLKELFQEGLFLIEAVPGPPECTSPQSVTFEVSGAPNGSFSWYRDRESDTPIPGQSNATLSHTITETTTLWASANSGWIDGPKVPVTLEVAPSIYNETAGLTYPSSLVASYDFSSNSDQTGTYANIWSTGVSPTTGLDGTPSSAIEFDSYPDIAVIPSATLQHAARFSVSMWIKSTETEVAILSASNAQNNNELLLYIAENDGIGLVLNEAPRIYHTNTLTDGNWHHLAITCDAINALGNVYLDGHLLRPKTDGSFKAGALNISQGAFILGNEQDVAGGGGLSQDYQFEGSIDELKLYRKVLDQQEVLALATQSDYFQSNFQIDGHAERVCPNDSLRITISPFQKEVEYSILDKNNMMVNGPSIVVEDRLILSAPVLAQDTFTVRATHQLTGCSKDFSTVIAAETGGCLQMEAWLEGPYDPTTNSMSDDLRARGLLPLSDPYTNQNFITPDILDIDDSKSVIDWVNIEFRDPQNMSQLVYLMPALILKNGTITGTDRQGLTLPDGFIGNFYVLLNHRNHLPVMTSAPISFGATSVSQIDFKTNPGFSNLGSNQKELVPGIYGLFSGDGDKSDLWGYDIHLAERILWAQENGYFGYYKASDYNLDGDVNSVDKIIYSGNNGVFSNIPK